MDRDTVISRLKGVESELKARGVIHAAVFGSVARDEQRPDSDIDIVVDIDPSARVGVYEFVGIMNFLEDHFCRKVDLSERRALRPFVRPSVERDEIHVF